MKHKTAVISISMPENKSAKVAKVCLIDEEHFDSKVYIPIEDAQKLIIGKVAYISIKQK